MKHRYILAASAALLLSTSARADWASCVSNLRHDAAAAGVSSATIAGATDGLEPNDAVSFMDKQPEFTTPVWDYIAGLVDEERVDEGRALLRQLRGGAARGGEAATASIRRPSSRCGASSRISARASASAGRAIAGDARLRGAAPQRLFPKGVHRGAEDSRQRRHLARRNSWAPGRAPSAIRNSCPRPFCAPRSISTATGAAISPARPPTRSAAPPIFCTRPAGGPGLRWGFEVRLPDGYSGPSGRTNRQPMSAWAARGIARLDGGGLGEGSAALLLPAGRNGPAFLVTQNFDAIYSYNAAESYALAICVLSDRLRGRPGIQTPWPTDDPGLSRAERRELQALLTRRGYDVGDPDGVIGTKTKEAIADFQGRVGLPRNGRASLKVLQALKAQ